jgi:hypothetical protein
VNHAGELHRFLRILAAIRRELQCRQCGAPHGVKHDPDRVEDKKIILQIQDLEFLEAAYRACQCWNVPARHALLCKLKGAQAPAEGQDVKQVDHMHFSELVVVHLEVVKMHEGEVFKLTEFQVYTASVVVESDAFKVSDVE